MAFPVTLNGRTYTLADFEGTNYVDGLPDAFEDFVTHAGDIYNSTSTSSVAIGTGSKTFTTADSGKPYQAGTPLRIADAAAPETNFMDAIVTSYSGTTLVVDVFGYAGSGTKTSWTINIGGAKTVDGTLAISQGGTGATSASGARTNIDVYSKAEADSKFLDVSGEASNVTMTGDVTIGDTSADTLTVNATSEFTGAATFGGSGGDYKIVIEGSGAPRQNYIGMEGYDTLLLAADEDNLGTDSEIHFRVDATLQALVDANGLTVGASVPTARDGALGVRSDSDGHAITIYEPAGANENWQIGVDADGDLGFYDSGSTTASITFQDGGSVGIGTDAPSTVLHTQGTSGTEVISGVTTNMVAKFEANGNDGGHLTINGAGSSTTGVTTLLNRVNGGDLAFAVRTSSTNTEAMRIDSSGKLLVGTTTSRALLTVEAASGFCGDFYTQTSTAGQDIWVLRSDVGGTANANFLLEANGDALNTNNSYGAISDARLKENITPAESQLDDIMAIEVVNYDWKDREGLPRQLGVVAQQLEEAGMGGLVSENQEGRKSVKYSVMYMKAIKAIQEQQAMIEELKAEVAALKGA